MTRIKICGITNDDDARAGVELGADALGFVLAPSPRQIEVEAARAIIRDLPPFITTVAVVVNEPLDDLRTKLQLMRCQVVQLHGDESPGYVQALSDWRVVKAFGIGAKRDLDGLADYAGADAFLLDSRVAGQAGGSGTGFDWRLARAAAAARKPIILAGGLQPVNVRAALAAARPYAVDVSSGVEAAPGKKDIALMREFIQAVREFDAQQS
jgi:phosphoribosylanthranilate isomerase